MPNITIVDQSVSEIPLPAYKHYVANITQAGTDAPVAVVLANNLGVLTWTRLDAGIYKLESAGNIFTENKTYVFMSNTSYDYQIGVYATWGSVTNIDIQTLYINDGFDGLILLPTLLEVRVYQ